MLEDSWRTRMGGERLGTHELSAINECTMDERMGTLCLFMTTH